MTTSLRSETAQRIADSLARIGARRTTVRHLARTLSPDGSAMLLVLLSLPFLLPMPPGAGAVGAVPLAAAAWVAASGRADRMPHRLARRRVTVAQLGRFLVRLDPILIRLERITRPRWPALLAPRRLFFVAVAAMIACIAAPLPTGNLPAAAALVTAGLALLRRDGVAALVMYAFAVLALAWNGAVAFAFAATLVWIF